MGASAIEQIYLPNCLCASGIKPTKSQISKEDWTFKLARSTYAQWPRASPRTTTSRHRRTAPVLSAGPAASHRERPRASPRTLPRYHREQPQSASPGAFRGPRRFSPPNSPGAFRGPRRFPPRTAPVLSASTRPRIILLSPAIPLNPAPLHLRQLVEPCHSLEPCSSTPASFP